MEVKSFVTGIVIGAGAMVLMSFTSGKGSWRYEAVVRDNEIFIIDTNNGRLKQATKNDSMQLNQNFDIMNNVPSKPKRGINEY